MRNGISVIFVSLVSLGSVALADQLPTPRPVVKEVFHLFPSQEPSGCSIGATLTAWGHQPTHGQMKGFEMSDFVEGFCEVWVDPSPRRYTVANVQVDGCGGVTYEAVPFALMHEPFRGAAKLVVRDNRNFRCPTLMPLPSIEVNETIGENTRHLETRFDWHNR